jgi:hypothetical protein
MTAGWICSGGGDEYSKFFGEGTHAAGRPTRAPKTPIRGPISLARALDPSTGAANRVIRVEASMVSRQRASGQVRPDSPDDAVCRLFESTVRVEG